MATRQSKPDGCSGGSFAKIHKFGQGVNMARFTRNEISCGLEICRGNACPQICSWVFAFKEGAAPEEFFNMRGVR